MIIDKLVTTDSKKVESEIATKQLEMRQLEMQKIDLDIVNSTNMREWAEETVMVYHEVTTSMTIIRSELLKLNDLRKRLKFLNNSVWSTIIIAAAGGLYFVFEYIGITT